MVGSAITRHLAKRGDEVLKADRTVVAKSQRNQIAVEVWLKQNRPDAIVFAAAKVGGINANDAFPADFIDDNLAIEANIIHSAHLAGVDRLLFLGSSWRLSQVCATTDKGRRAAGAAHWSQPKRMVRVIAGIKLCQAYRKQYGHRYISLMPCNPDLWARRQHFDSR